MEGLIFGILRYAVLRGSIWKEFNCAFFSQMGAGGREECKIENKLNSILCNFFLCFGYSVFIGVIILLLKDS